jgi:hypothetical protein
MREGRFDPESRLPGVLEKCFTLSSQTEEPLTHLARPLRAFSVNHGTLPGNGRLFLCVKRFSAECTPARKRRGAAGEASSAGDRSVGTKVLVTGRLDQFQRTE